MFLPTQWNEQWVQDKIMILKSDRHENDIFTTKSIIATKSGSICCLNARNKNPTTCLNTHPMNSTLISIFRILDAASFWVGFGLPHSPSLHQVQSRSPRALGSQRRPLERGPSLLHPPYHGHPSGVSCPTRS